MLLRNLVLGLIGAAVIAASPLAFAQKSGGGKRSLGLGGGIATASQDDINNYITALNTAGTKSIGSAYEGYADFGYRFGGTAFGILLRPTYFTQSATGGNITASLNGYTFIPMMRVYPLENNFMRFFMQVGAGYGSLSGTLTNSTSSVKFAGSAFGAQAGMGAEFCITASHCISVEGNLRYMPIYRNMVSSVTGSMGGTMGTPTLNGELETLSNGIDNNVITTMGGLTAYAGYSFKF